MTAASFVVEPIDYAMTAVQCVTDGCSLAEVALTVVPGAIGPVAKQIDNVLDVARAAENAGDAVKAVETGGDAIHAAENGSDAAKAVDPCQLSFSADTLVTTADGLQAISTLAIGEQVLAYNPVLDVTGYYTITGVWIHRDALIEYVTIDGERIQTTPNHPFYTEEYGWLRADELWLGAHVRQADGGAGVVRAIRFAWRVQPMYNLTVADAHTYFVGQQQWLVHNCAGRGGANDLADDLPDLSGRKFTNDVKFAADELGLSKQAYSKAQHRLKGLLGGKIKNPDVLIDYETGDIFTPSGDWLGSLLDE